MNSERYPIPVSKMGKHDVLPEFGHDGTSRLDFVESVFFHLQRNIYAGNEAAYRNRVEPAYVRANGKRPDNRKAVAREMTRDPFYQTWSSLNRSNFEMMFDTSGEIVERQLDDLIDRSRSASGGGGSLDLDPNLDIPRYLEAVDRHCMPGGYCTELTDDDVYAGALYETGSAFVLTGGRIGAYNEGPGQAVVNFLKHKHPARQIGKLLDVGCAVGNSTLPYVDAFPDAEIHAVEPGAPLVRYAHARAESLGRKVHFSQQDAQKLKHADDSFDVVVSTMVLHETSRAAMPKIIKEMHRVLKPGGIMINVEQPQNHGMEPYEAFIRDWQTLNNNEPFWGTLHDMNLDDVAHEAGFERSNVRQTMEPAAYRDELPDEPGRKGPKEVYEAKWFFFTGIKSAA